MTGHFLRRYIVNSDIVESIYYMKVYLVFMFIKTFVTLRLKGADLIQTLETCI